MEWWCGGEEVEINLRVELKVWTNGADRCMVRATRERRIDMLKRKGKKSEQVKRSDGGVTINWTQVEMMRRNDAMWKGLGR